MRTIKFRAWDGEKMYDWMEFKEDGGWIVPHTLAKGVKAVMQFTGLLDKNGEEIYEGDITKEEGDITHDKKQNVRQVYFAEGSFWAGNLREDGSPCIFISLQNYAKGVEIIGNIYENPELIQDTNSTESV